MVKKSRNNDDDDSEEVVTDEGEELEEVEEEEEEEEEDYELDDYNSNDDSDYSNHSHENGNDGTGRRNEQPGNQPSNDSSSGSSYSLMLIAIILGGILVSVVPLYFYNPPNSSNPSTSSSSASQSFITPVCPLPPGQKLFTKTELATYIAPPKILLGFLGVVYDVTSGGSYYQPPDGAYSFFAGKDGTRGFLTGEFTPDQLVDDITDLEESTLSGLDTWISLYEEKYKRVGFLAGGAYYDAGGCPTEKQKWVQEKMKAAKEVAEDSADLERQFPPCNSQWEAATRSGRVWCSTASGGVSRPWTGRPRQFYVLSSKSWRCACLREDEDVPPEDWCDGDQKGSKAKVVKVPSTGVKYAPGEGGGANCLWKHYQRCDVQAIECPIAD